MTSSPSAVFIVEDYNTDDGRMTFWAHAYLSQDKAMAGVAWWAPARKKGPLTWSGTSAYWSDGKLAYSVVGVAVHPDDKPEAARAL